jgi:peptide/nickel transport system substrate-binding protein
MPVPDSSDESSDDTVTDPVAAGSGRTTMRTMGRGPTGSRPAIRTIVALLAATLVLAACGGGDDTADEATTGDTSTDADSGTADGDAETAEPGASTFVVALDTDVNLLEPHTFRSTAAYSVTDAMYAPPLSQVLEDQGGDGKLFYGVAEFEGELAEDWTVDDDGTTTFTIRDDAGFADGTPITAHDLAYTLRRSIEGPGYIGALLPFINISSADQIEAEDDYTLVVQPDGSSPFFEQFMAFQVFGALDEDRIEAEAADDDEWGMAFLEENPTESGPYRLATFDRESQVVLEPNENYPHQDRVMNDGVTVRFVPDADQRALLLQRGELDLVSGLSPRLLQELDADTNVDVLSIPSSRITYMGMNNSIEPLDDVTLRQAISYAVPYQTLIDQVMAGYARPAGNLVTSPMDTYAGDEIGTYEEDLDRARELVAEAGAEGASLELAVRQSRAQEQEAATFIQDNLRQIGLNVEVSRLPDSEFSERLNAKELQLFIHDWFSWGEDPYYQMQFLVHSEAFTNHTTFANEELDALIAEGTFELDEARRAEISRDAQQILLDEAPMAYLYSPDTTVAVRSDVCGVAFDFTQVVRLDTLTRCE